MYLVTGQVEASSHELRIKACDYKNFLQKLRNYFRKKIFRRQGDSNHTASPCHLCMWIWMDYGKILTLLQAWL